MSENPTEINDVPVVFFNFTEQDTELVEKLKSIVRQSVFNGDPTGKGWIDIHNWFIEFGVNNVIVSCGQGVAFYKIKDGIL